jgi:hypothetical protein
VGFQRFADILLKFASRYGGTKPDAEGFFQPPAAITRRTVIMRGFEEYQFETLFGTSGDFDT